MSPELRKLVKGLKPHGCEVRLAKSSHYHVVRDGKRLVSFSLSPSDTNWWRQVRRDLKRHHGIHL